MAHLLNGLTKLSLSHIQHVFCCCERVKPTDRFCQDAASVYFIMRSLRWVYIIYLSRSTRKPNIMDCIIYRPRSAWAETFRLRGDRGYHRVMIPETENPQEVKSACPC